MQFVEKWDEYYVFVCFGFLKVFVNVRRFCSCFKSVPRNGSFVLSFMVEMFVVLSVVI